MSESTNLFPGLRIVLVETSHPGNIGAAARAMKNMGVTELWLVNPEDFPRKDAFFRAASAEDLVTEARVVSSLDEAIGDCQLVIGTSARGRRIPWPMLDPEACGKQVVAEIAAGARVALLFGRESRGLTNEELQRCQFHVTIPTGDDYSSLNLAMAVQVITYEVLKARLAGPPAKTGWDMPLADAEAVGHLMAHLEETLMQLGFHDPDNPRQLMTRLHRMFQRIRPDQMEVNILRGFLNSVNKSAVNKSAGNEKASKGADNKGAVSKPDSNKE